MNKTVSTINFELLVIERFIKGTDYFEITKKEVGTNFVQSFGFEKIELSVILLQFRIEFGVKRYEAIKRCQFEKVKKLYNLIKFLQFYKIKLYC